MKQALILLIIISVSIASCKKEKKIYKYEDVISNEVKERKKQQANIELIPGQEQQKKESRIYLAEMEKAELVAFYFKITSDFITENDREMTKDEILEFKKQIEYDKNIRMLDEIISKNK